MIEKLQLYSKKVTQYWSEQSSKQKAIILGSSIGIIFLIIILTYFGTKTNYEPLYTDLTLQETGQIQETLNARGISTIVTDDGSSILVPESQVGTLKVELAAEGIPNSGSIDYGFIKDQMGFGTTDNEFTVIERAAMQTELANLIRNLDGVNQANVMITLPEESVWANSPQESATAAINLNLAPGKKLEQSEVRALFHLVSKSVPNLPIDNIVISDQMFNDYLYENGNNSDSTFTVYEEQRAIQRDIEHDLTRNIQQMLGTVVGQDKVFVSVTTDIDFTKENRTESLVEPVDPENMEGIAVSIERIAETYSGEGVPEGGVPGTGDEIPNYNTGIAGQGPSEWDKTEERINNEVNRINRDIVESPYKVRDLGIQVMVEPPEGLDVLPQERLDDLQQILATIVRTSIADDYTSEWTDQDIDEKIFVSSQVFEGKPNFDFEAETVIPLWLYIIGAILIITIILLIILLFRKRNVVEEEEEFVLEEVGEGVPELPDEDTSVAATKRKQLEKMAQEKPDEFSKLLRTWLSDD